MAWQQQGDGPGIQFPAITMPTQLRAPGPAGVGCMLVTRLAVNAF